MSYHLAIRGFRFFEVAGSRSARTISVASRRNGILSERIELVQAYKHLGNKGKASFLFLFFFFFFFFFFIFVHADRTTRREQLSQMTTLAEIRSRNRDENSRINRTVNEVALRSMDNAWVVMYEIARVPTLRRVVRCKCTVTDERAARG